MILNNDQLLARAREFALSNELRATNRLNASFWPAFRADMASLRTFAEQLTNSRAECMQPAEDWLLDHIAFLETQAQGVIRRLPRATLRKLPKLQDTGMPRIYGICDDYLTHVDGHYDVHSFAAYVRSYQEVSVLKIAECWALPTAMRVVIIRRLAQAMRDVQYRHDVCNSVASLLERLGEKNMSDAEIRACLERETRRRTFSAAEVVHLVRHLSEWEPDIRMVQDWLAAHVENSEASLEQMVSFEHHLQSELQVTCGNLVQSMHILERQPWRLTFTKISCVEQILLSDTNSEYERMDFASRDLLRRRVAEIARQLNVPETLVAQTAVRLAQQCHVEACSPDVPAREMCLAHYLLDPHGIAAMRKALCEVTRPRRLPQIAIRRRPLSVYMASVTLLFIGLLLLAGAWTAFGIRVRPLSWVATFIALALPASEWAIAIVHAWIGKCCRPAALLRYDFSDGLPEDARTMVVMPIIWSDLEDVDDVVERLEVHYLANREQHIHFAVLADFSDAPVATQADDKKLVAHAIARIQALQAKYGSSRFFLLHRSRRYNAVDDVYMGWERKRGKLVEFVELLSGNGDTSFTTVYGQADILQDIRYVFTVDHDTQLPIGVVSRMAGTIHFPYNRPRLNESGTRVSAGFGVLQPRIGVSFESVQKSRFAALWAGEPGIDPYAFAVSNPYQDLFGQAIFVGKGIFDVEAFRKTLVNRIPDHHVLSHDLLEGGFLRAGLAADIEVVEEHPSTFYAYERRAHRWMRGDWQLIKWLGRTCKDRYGDRQHVDLCGLTRWQIIDNLRRSLLAPALFLVALLGVRVLPGREMAWETIVLSTIFLPFLRAIAHGFVGRGSMRTVGVTFLQSVVQLVTLPFAAVLALDAMLRTLYRVFVSRRKLLEWVPAAQMDRGSANRRVFVYESAGYAVIVLFAVLTWLSGGLWNHAFAVAALSIWLLARPFIQQLNRPSTRKERAWLAAARPELRELARQIWSFYERYVTADESWLPPDNVQYHPHEIVAHRTSPTNIGLYLASVIAARDLDFIDTLTMVERLELTMQTLQGMEKWNGHLLNWYDTISAKPLAPRYVSTVDSGNLVAYLMVVRQGLRHWSMRESALQSRMEGLMEEIDRFIEQTNFQPLFNVDERLFCLGCHVDTNRRETILYDLLASEARQASFVAISLGQIPVSHWFTLARTMTLAGGCKTLLSWSGTMFEYLMPSLIMRTYRNTVWDSTYRGVVDRQREYADRQRVPFGISESGYYAFDYQLNYQYRAFGVPGLGLERGLERNLVVAPYAAIMALPFAGDAGMAALRKFEDFGAKGKYGFYEAVDFTVQRLPAGSRHEVVQSFMAHHQGMSMLSIVNLLADEIMIARFHADPRVRATNLLLQERVPAKAALIEELPGLHGKLPEFKVQADDAERTFREQTALPEVNVLSNGRLTSVATNDGNGFLTWNGLAVTRWQEDPVVGTSGVIVYVHEVATEETWSITRFPCQTADNSSVRFHLDKTTCERNYKGMSSKLDLAVSPDVDAEVRRIQFVNNSGEERTLEVTSFLELALASQSDDRAHPAFSKLFIQTSHDAAARCLLAKRRPREEDEQEVWAVHTVYVDGHDTGDYEYETDRAAFIGRGYSLQAPQALNMRLRGSAGSVADPAFVMRRRIHLAPQESAAVYIVTGVADSREQAIEIIYRLCEPAQADRTFHLAWVRTQIDLRHLHLSPAQASAAQLLAGRLLFTPPLSRVRKDAIAHNALGQSVLWSRGISGDAPVVTVCISNLADLPFVTLLARQHQYLCALGLALDLVVLDETKSGYQDELMHRLRENLAARGIGEMKRIAGVKESQLSLDERTLLVAVSRVWLRAGGPSLRAQLQIDEGEPRPLPGLQMQRDMQRQHVPHISAQGEFFNGWGSFIEDGQAYQIHVQNGAYLSRPLSNVLANPQFGCILTELGTGYSWWRNSRECKLTPWNNDPVLDPPGECLYLCDIDTNKIWSAAPKPAGGDRTYQVVHGWGFSRIEQMDGEILHTMETTVPLNDPLKIIRLHVRNMSEDTKRISVTYYAEWVIGVMREAQAPFVVTEWDPEICSLLARNTYQEAFRDAVGFLHMTRPNHADVLDSAAYSWTGDRTEFIGRGGTPECPAALYDGKLSGRTGTFSNTCGAVQTVVELPAKGETEVIILFGCAAAKEKVQALVHKYSRASAYADTLAGVTRFWQRITGQVKVKTPDRAMDLLLNGWLLYQALTCRLWARTAFYQAGGAFGFRDQLQDSLAFLHADSSITRQQILLNAAHQYQEGDVQHWWHEETKKGIRTRFSDDLLWLPYAVSRYLEHTGDIGILHENVPFLHSDALQEGELERYEDTVVSDERGSLLEHCLRAIRHAMRFGEHGIPLMGIGDWNDGMSRIGAKGRGESVWLGWFLLDILKRFAQMENVGVPPKLVEQFAQTAHELEQHLNEHAWDGAWFRRAFTDAGKWLGSIENKECRIDAIAQSWAVISQGTSKDRQMRGMRSFDRELVDRELGLARLLTKAFDETQPSPGYIQGYPPGIRENGGQYTHGVIWSIVAWAMLDRRDQAFDLFSMLNPISHTRTVRDVRMYANEPYVMSADVYTADPHQGRAGWSWYTGAAGWMYQAGLEYVLGVFRRGDRLYIRPCVPMEWDSFTLEYNYGATTYCIEVNCEQGGKDPSTWVVDGQQAVNQSYLQLVDDGRVHHVTVQTTWQSLSTVG
ncbi:carbohydrate-binding protein [Fodinisporobacter ferrooxydans]|uniref:Carbohydrate-binding protein n=1 Tax=Fodinisporobacter ferrooxydans TaxID=2901836 RepID=A0ABY4CHH8_9BACL|nr:carbohydrate-binding protein [Alicyclobacillaceae bacterium MYW30-H2]